MELWLVLDRETSLFSGLAELTASPEPGVLVLAEEPGNLLVAGSKMQLEDWLDWQEANGCLPRCNAFPEISGFSVRALGNSDSTTHGIAQGQCKDGRWYVAAFTDPDLARRFAERIESPNIATFPEPTPRDWLAFLEFCAEIGHELIAINPEPGRPLRIASIGHVIQVVRDLFAGLEDYEWPQRILHAVHWTNAEDAGVCRLA
jgi:hypothetical protein